MPAKDENLELTPQEKGGHARAAALSGAQRKEIARKAALVLWTAPKATHEGPLRIGNVELPCAVLEDGTRVLSRTGFLRAIGRTGKAKGGRKYDQEFQMPVFLTAENLKPFIDGEILENSKPIQYRPLAGGALHLGYRADLLPAVCHVFIDAKDAGALRPNQLHIAETCKVLSRAFSVVGLTALIDAATGYEEVRDRQALQRILDAYLSRELAAWAKRFPDEFYKELFRLKGWQWPTAKGKGPRVVAAYTNDFVYARLAPGILDELKRRNPIDDSGKRKAKHHQWLTEDIGNPALVQHLHAVMALMRAAPSWDQFKTGLERAFPRRTDLRDLPLFSGLSSSTA